jgi:hypothetical protein
MVPLFDNHPLLIIPKFIASATGQDHDAIRHELQTDTSDIQMVKATHPKDGHSVVFLDVPNFDASSSKETLSMISDLLVERCVLLLSMACMDIDYLEVVEKRPIL